MELRRRASILLRANIPSREGRHSRADTLPSSSTVGRLRRAGTSSVVMSYVGGYMSGLGVGLWVFLYPRLNDCIVL
jgi:hypothetical protein